MNEPVLQSPRLLWQPSPQNIADSNLSRYLAWLKAERGLEFAPLDYPALWSWSVNEPGAFWESIAAFFQVRFNSDAEIPLKSLEMPGAKWFEGATLNYAEHALNSRNSVSPQETAIIFETEASPGNAARIEKISREELRSRVALVAAQLRAMGVRKGDCVAGYLSNTPETVIAFLASVSLGAVWSNCAVEMTSRSVLDRLTQIEPKVLFGLCGYIYGGKKHARAQMVQEIAAGLPSLRHVVVIGDADGKADVAVSPDVTLHEWNSLVELSTGDAVPELKFEPVAFDHPLWILYSSGTTGRPKAIVHGHGGIMLEHLKTLSLHLDIRAGDHFFWYTTSGWMMWNFLVSGLLLSGVAIVLYDGSPKSPDFGILWDVVERHGVTLFGASAPYFRACIKDGVEPGRRYGLERLRCIGSTGAPLPPEDFVWIYEHVKQDILLSSLSGGTDVCSAFVLSNPHLPVYSGKLQCLGLGAKIEAWDDRAQPVYGEMGELVLTVPYPTMPLFLWGDEDGSRMRSSYFEKFPGIWSHGDWIEIDPPAHPGEPAAGPCVIHGRSDATLNRGGVRMGTVEFYSVVEALPEVAEALVIDTGGLGREDKLLLFVVLQPGVVWSETLSRQIALHLRNEVSPRHVPDAIYPVAEIPRTLNGKKLEVPIKRILAGTAVEKVVHPGAMANPDSLEPFLRLAKELNSSKPVSAPA
ncbi:MAG: acetoacetate--CoA ligase [Candidatus Methylacidiphilales bacterium]|nr:acetoacetate--CoA ligase [Candidatus Methylacidiphilales bacterium]